MKQNQFATKVKDEENKYADSNTAQVNRKSAHSKRPPDGINTINNNINNDLKPTTSNNTKGASTIPNIPKIPNIPIPPKFPIPSIKCKNKDEEEKVNLMKKITPVKPTEERSKKSYA